jgi:hypothetical protein
VTLTNSGTAGVTLSQATITGNGFSFSGPTLPLTLAAGQTTSFNVTFAPTTGGNASGSLSVLSNASNSPSAVSLTGNGLNPLPPGVTYIQGNYATPQTPQTVVKVTFPAAQLSGDLNVVVVGWNDSTATVSAVVDSAGNTYVRAVGPTVRGGALSQSIYYAKNIVGAAAGTNTVTVTFSKAAIYPDIRIVEYSGLDPINPVDVTAAKTGSSANSSTGAVTTTNANDLLFAANIVTTFTSGPGSSFTRRLLTNPDGDIVQDRMVTTTGSYSTTAPLSSSGQWIMQLVAFRAR